MTLNPTSIFFSRGKRLFLSWALLISLANIIIDLTAKSLVINPIKYRSLHEGKSGKSSKNSGVPLCNDVISTAMGSERENRWYTGALSQRRRILIQQSVFSFCSSPVLLGRPSLSAASDETAALFAPSEPFTRTLTSNKKEVGYIITPPPSFTQSSKPLKTHLDEINFSSSLVPRYSLGVTIDPVRISSIRQFGTPEEVAARVVTAEVNRDGVFQVTLSKDPKEDLDAGGCYDVEYTSEGKRGVKRFVTRIFVRDGFLYVLTVQARESDYNEEIEKEVLKCIESFRPLRF